MQVKDLSPSCNIYLESIRRGLIILLPLIYVGSLSLLINHFPISSYQNFMTDIFGTSWKETCTFVWHSTFGIMNYSLILTVSYNLSYRMIGNKKGLYTPFICCIVTMCCGMIMVSQVNKGVFQTGNPYALLSAILSAIIFTKIFIKIRSLAFVEKANNCLYTTSAFQDTLKCIIPALITVTSAILLKSIFISTDKYGDVLLESLFKNAGNGLFSAIIFVFLVHVLWFLGMHGSNIMQTSYESIMVQNLAENSIALQQGQELPHVITKPFFDSFVMIGGVGATISLVVLMLLMEMKRKSNFRLDLWTLIPSFFNINEMITFGLPLVLNPRFIIPFIATPIVLTITGYTATILNFVPAAALEVNWTTPPLINAYVSTGSINGIILQCANIGIGILIYLPFYKKYLSEESYYLTGLKEALKELSSHKHVESLKGLLDQSGMQGNVARRIAAELDIAIKENQLKLFYQPILDQNENVTKVEALLRWFHDDLGFIPPNVIVHIAEESNKIIKLGDYILNLACRDLKQLQKDGITNVRFSINVSPSQLFEVGNYKQFLSIFAHHAVSTSDIELEITENIVIDESPVFNKNLTELAAAGISISLDDFGMGYTSLINLKNLNAHTLKIDGSLTKEVLDNEFSQNIIKTIIYLTSNSDLNVVAEFVETEDHFNLLKEYGCKEFQGYYFSRPLPYSDAVNYIKQQNSI